MQIRETEIHFTRVLYQYSNMETINDIVTRFTHAKLNYGFAYGYPIHNIIPHSNIFHHDIRTTIA